MGIQSDPKVVVRGDDLKIAEGRALAWDEDQAATPWPDPLDGTVDLELGDAVYPGVIDTATGVQRVHIELTRIQTAALPAGTLDYHLRATQANGDVVSLAIGKIVAR